MPAPPVEAPSDPSSLTDSQLIEAALSGVQDAYTEIVYRYKDRLLTSMRGVVSCSESAEDIVQDAFVKAFSKLDTFRAESSFYTWLYRIAQNSRRFYVRNRHRTLPLETMIEQHGASWVAPLPTPSALVEKQEECEHVREALSRLEHHHRAILVLREFEGCDYQAISEVLEVTMGTVRSRLSRARAQLRKELACYWTSVPAGEIPRYDDERRSEHDLLLTA